MIIGGPPCQGFSNKGKKLGLNDPRNFLFKEYIKLVSSLNPEIFIIENVKTILTTEKGWFINEIVKEIEKLNYHVSYKILNASDFGVPQHRQRAFIIASKTKKINFDLLDNFKKEKATVRDAISDLNYLESGEGDLVSSYILDCNSDYQFQCRKDSGKLYNHIATKHSREALFKLSLIPSEKGKEYLPKELLGKQKFKTTWSRLKWDEQSPTVDTRFDTPSNGKNSHPVLNRAITAREAARIQSFPDKFRFYGNKTNICKQIGNAVPPLLAEAVGRLILESYNE